MAIPPSIVTTRSSTIIPRHLKHLIEILLMVRVALLVSLLSEKSSRFYPAEYAPILREGKGMRNTTKEGFLRKNKGF